MCSTMKLRPDQIQLAAEVRALCEGEARLVRMIECQQWFGMGHSHLCRGHAADAVQSLIRRLVRCVDISR